MDVGGNDVDVSVGDGITTEVAVISAANVSVGDDIGSVVDVEPLEAEVCVTDGNEGAVTVVVSDIGMRVGDEIGGATVVATSLVAVT